MTELRYTKQDVLDLNAEAWFKIMVEELKTLSAQFWNQRLSDASGNPIPGSSGKFGWCWKLPAPAWEWDNLTGIRSRQIRML